MSMLGTLPVVAEELLKKVRQVYQEQSQLTDELLLALKFVFGPAALHALELVDRRSVTLVQSPSGRSLYQAPAPSSRSRCCCNQKWKAPTLECKHILAVYLCQAMGVSHQLKVSDKQLTSFLLAKDKEPGASAH
ncbi:zinc finger SWIM domain-containing protein 7 isoform X6 [Stegostoma tigrinum]|uniref:zinc finger SWIM domain-containing protein 7 isoform X6 n=1 Tax=Stegostoma tigrinum TaxID=3053191 RepID=UPI00286FE6F9|nr:zinc finger SWIM domain-containing protein 7 isoform X6 [Stegostoma tigrinum]